MVTLRLTRRLVLASSTFLCALPLTGALAQSAPASDSGIAVDELVITAQKRTERLEDVTASADVLQAGALDSMDIGNIADLDKMIPALDLSGAPNGRVPLGIRGVSSVTNTAAVGIPSGVAILVDGVPIPSDSVSANKLEDLQRVEVLEGPQATLGGRAAAQGVVNMVTRAPADMWSGSASATTTDDAEHRVSGFITGPVVPGLLDLSLSGYGNSTDYPIKNLYYDTRFQDDNFGFHGKLLYTPSADLDVTLAAFVTQDHSYGSDFTYAYVQPGAALLGNPLFGVKQLLPGITLSQANQYQNSPVTDAGAQAYDASVSLNIDYKLGDYTLSSTTAYQHDSQKTVTDLFTVYEYFYTVLTKGASSFNNNQTVWKTVEQTSEELKLASPADKPLNYIAGMFFSDNTADESTYRPLPVSPQIFGVTTDSKTYDLYGRGTWTFLPDTSLVVGLRYDDDDISYGLNQTANGIAKAFQSAGSDSSTSLVGDVSLKYQLAKDSMVYATYSRGYAPKAYNTTATLTSDASLAPVGQEHIDDFEIGTKGSYFDRHLILNATAFDTIYHDFQIQTSQVTAGTVVATPILSNAGQASTKGIEGDAVLKLDNSFRVTTHAAYVVAVFDDYTNAACYSYAKVPPAGCHLYNGSSVQDLSGRPMPNAPRLKFDIGAEKRFVLDVVPYDLVMSGHYNYQTQAQMLGDENPYGVMPAFGILDLSTTLQAQSGAYSMTFFVNNVLDHHYATLLTDIWGSAWTSNAIAAVPARDSNRYLGVRLNADF